MATTTNFGWETPDDTDLVKDGAAAMRTLGNSIDTSFVDLKGGTSGQILSKASNTDLDYTWITNDIGDITAVTAGTGLSGGGTSGAVTLSIDTATTVDLSTAQTLTNKTLTSPVLTTPSISTIDAKGDLLVGTADATISRLAVGTNGHVLTADSTTATGLKWAALPAGGGKVLQVVSTTKTDTFTTTSASYTDVTGYSVTITPTSSTSKILVLYDININADPATHGGWGRLVRGSTDIKIGDSSGGRPQVTIAKETQNFYNDLSGQSGNFLDSPATTSATTYKIQVTRIGGTGSDIVCVNRTEQDNTDRPRGACTITVMEIGA
jgi:hypothetical protein